MTQRLKGKVAVITGAGSPVGIGRSLALEMAAEGASLVVNDIRREDDGTMGADKVVEEIKKANGTAVANYDSVVTMEGAENIIKTAISNFGRIDILANPAGGVRAGKTIAELTEDDWDSDVNVNLKGVFNCCKAAAVEMMKQKSGRIINFSSGAAFDSPRLVLPPRPDIPASDRPQGRPRMPLMIAYSSAKAGVLGLTVSLSKALQEDGITVNAIVPAAVTDLFKGQRPRWGGGNTEGPDWVVPIIVYLATDEAQNITGQFFYSCAGDICIYDRPMQIPGPHRFIRKMGKWTVDELSEVIPALLEAD
jgi:NAD(P)-dependent dehydrogenase (short-subunit alcohol dehydrogenase family)